MGDHSRVAVICSNFVTEEIDIKSTLTNVCLPLDSIFVLHSSDLNTHFNSVPEHFTYILMVQHLQ